MAPGGRLMDTHGFPPSQQPERAEAWVAAWRAVQASTARVDRDRAERAMVALYRERCLETPRFLWVSDPTDGLMAWHLASRGREPLRAEQPYDFPNSDLARRARETSLEALAHHRLPNPPSETLFLHRKLGGSFLLAAHIGAVVDTRALYRRFVLRA